MTEEWAQLEAFSDEPKNTVGKEEVSSITPTTFETAATESLPRINPVRARYVIEAEESLKNELNGEPFSHMDVAVRATQKWLEDNAIMAHPPDRVRTEDKMLETYEQYLAAKEKYPIETLNLILHGAPIPEQVVSQRKTRIKRVPNEGWEAKLEREQDEREEELRKIMGLPDPVTGEK